MYILPQFTKLYFQMSNGNQSPLVAERHRSRSSSIPSKSSTIPLPFTMAQIAQQFENVNFFDGSSKDLTNTSSTPDFNTSNGEILSLNFKIKFLIILI
jgi:hypothetical protein